MLKLPRRADPGEMAAAGRLLAVRVRGKIVVLSVTTGAVVRRLRSARWMTTP